MAHVGIVGGGLAGAAAGYWLVRLCPGGTTVTVFEPAESLGRGIAYQQAPDHLLLNVPARYLSPVPGDQQHFLRWLIANRIADLFRFREPDGAFFVPRAWFGDYIASMLSDAVKRRRGAVELRHERAAVLSIEAGERPGVVTGVGTHAVDHLILTLGVAPPRRLPVRPDTTCKVVQSAWQLFAEPPFPSAWKVAIVGSGLTMADAVAELSVRGHKGPITVVSRHGLMPHVSGGHLPEYELPSEPLEKSARLLMRQVRRWAADAVASDVADWRPIFDQIRQNAQAFWRTLPEVEQRRFRRHVRTYWEIHRYPMPPATFRTLRRAMASGQLVHRKGVATGVGSSGLLLRGGAEEDVIHADLVINAAGPDPTYGTAPSNGLAPLLAPMGLDCAQAQAIGVSIDDDGLVLGCVPPFSGRIWSTGYLARRRFGELGTVNAIADVAKRSATRISEDLGHSAVRSAVPLEQGAPG